MSDFARGSDELSLADLFWIAVFVIIGVPLAAGGLGVVLRGAVRAFLWGWRW